MHNKMQLFAKFKTFYEEIQSQMKLSEKLMVPCEVLLIRNTSTGHSSSQIVEVVADSLGRPAFADQLV